MKNREVLGDHVGRFFVVPQLVQEQPDKCAMILASLSFVPYYVNYDRDLDTYIYLGYSRKFAEIKIGDQIPFYEIVVTDLNGGTQQQVEVVREQDER